MLLSRFVQPVDPEFVCVACGAVLSAPMRYVACQHECCAECVTADRCPACGAASETVAALKTAALLSKLLLSCDFHAKGCGWTGPWATLQAHRTSQCEFQLVVCPFPGCTFSSERRALPLHTATCPSKTKQCQACLRIVKARDLALHEARCPLVVLPCPKGCGETVRREALDAHFATVCPLHVLECPMQEFGCGHRCARQEMNHHLVGGVHHHLARLVEILRVERDTHRQVVDALQRRLETQEEQLESLRRHGPLPADVDAMRQQLAEQQWWIDRFSSGLTCVVDPCGAGNCTSIEQAVTRAAPGELILVRPGEYSVEALHLTVDGLTIRGAGDGGGGGLVKVVSSITVSANNVRLENMTLMNVGAVGVALRVDASAFHAKQCRFHNGARATVIATQNATVATFTECVMSGGGGCETRGSVTFDQCVLEKADQSAICVHSGECIVRQCDIQQAALNGIEMLGGLLHVTNSTVADSAFSNIDVTGGSARVEDSSIMRSNKCGVCVRGAEARLFRCDLAHNTLPNVAVLQGGAVLLEACRVHHSKSHGVAVKTGGKCTLNARCNVYENADANIGIEEQRPGSAHTESVYQVEKS